MDVSWMIGKYDRMALWKPAYDGVNFELRNNPR